MRLIDACALQKAIRTDYFEHFTQYHDTDQDSLIDMVCDDIEESPTVDAVEVVRCRECKYWGDEAGELQRSDRGLFARCKVHNYLLDGRHTGWCPTENDFCSYGEREEGAD